ncbi:MAG: PEP-CTERM sorting domain-containing protein [Planctomycetes bacterium]|nr:PEP-CTERM sorting domain-containing protein [Planctomycetota bacterium]
MKRMSTTMGVLAILLAVASTVPALAQHDHEDLIIGRTGGGQLKVEFGHWDEAHGLDPVSGLIEGWAADHPGLAALDVDEPGEDFFTLEPGAQIVFEVMSFDPAFKVHTPGFADVLDDPGDRWLVGDHELHKHPQAWHIDSEDPDYDPQQTVWHAEFRFLDVGTTGYTPSDTYTLTFTPVPEPTTAFLIGWGFLALLRCRKSCHNQLWRCGTG